MSPPSYTQPPPPLPRCRSRPQSPRKREPETTDPRVLRAQEAAAKKKAKSDKEKPKPVKKSSQKGKGMAAVGGAVPEGDTVEAPTGAEAGEGVAHRMRRLVAEAFLQLALVREQEWRLRKALDYALEALAWAERGPGDEERGRLRKYEANDVLERSAVPQETWLEAKVAVARLCFKLGALGPASEALASARADAEACGDSWCLWRVAVMARRCALLGGVVLDNCRQLKALWDQAVRR